MSAALAEAAPPAAPGDASIDRALSALGVAGPITIGGAPEGWDAFLLAEAARRGRTILHIARDEARLTALIDTLSAVAPDVAVYALPAWDCLPYDRVSPAADAMARRLDTLCALAARAESDGAFILVTTVAAATQRTPPRATLAGAAIDLAPGSETAFDALTGQLAALGYARADTVHEAGEYAVRGGIVDLFPPGHEEPLRLDFFGDSVETIRRFDPVTQSSAGTLDRLTIKPVEEAPLDDAAIARFRRSYRERFGAGGGSDPLYEAVSAGRRYPGLEHWAPLFHERMETLFDFAPEASVTLDDGATALIA
ncbi:MAG: transcription-repair coupling factor, partial [Pseudomonadota bacterium]